MPSDFGDDSGEKMVDWMMRVGQDMGGDAMAASAERLAKALRNARGGAEDGPAAESEDVAEWARLNMREFEELPEYGTIRQIIDERLSAEGVRHEFTRMGEHDNLVFLVEDAPAVNEVFEGLEEQAGKCAEVAQERLKAVLEHANEQPLAEKAQAAREASKAMEAAKGKSREIERAELRSK